MQRSSVARHLKKVHSITEDEINQLRMVRNHKLVNWCFFIFFFFSFRPYSSMPQQGQAPQGLEAVLDFVKNTRKPSRSKLQLQWMVSSCYYFVLFHKILKILLEVIVPRLRQQVDALLLRWIPWCSTSTFLHLLSDMPPAERNYWLPTSYLVSSQII